ncbi:Dihydroorotase [Cedecea lapagei]|uniref:Dihydroorotase n=1 Tax=Cedecea lapagei TaxID=158823 RepID=A0A3S4IIZ7_9ENTR|nr:dihydroorotase [Cedecea lapagei]VEB98903.1 Dihydroorotase [Cedecea lapagei]
MKPLLLTNALIINEDRRHHADLLIVNGRIEKIAATISPQQTWSVLDLNGKWLLPGMIDDQVHFREPGLMHKGTLASESRAAVMGGITSYMEMPNVSPPTTTRQALQDKFQRASECSLANYSFYFGATNDNLEELKALATGAACGVKVFMGASTGNMLVDDERTLEAIFQYAPGLVATHCEDTPTIKHNEALWRTRYGVQIPAEEHAAIRSVEACLLSSSRAVALAKKHGTRLHVLHITTADELALFEPAPTLADLRRKTITAEACIHHLYFNKDDYATLGHRLKCNPSVKGAEHQQALWQAVRAGVIDIIATDHAPHLLAEKQSDYFAAPSGLPLVQHALPALLDLCARDIFTPELIVRKTSHAVAERFQIKDRGYIREGYWADLAAINPWKRASIDGSNIAYKCGWSPFEGHSLLGGVVENTFVNGRLVWDGESVMQGVYGSALEFNR